MEPIINPILFYWMNVGENLWGVSVAFAVVFVAGFIGSIAAYLYNESEAQCFEENANYAKIARKLCIITSIVAVLSLLIVVFVPRKNTVIEMMIASGVTTDNISAGVSAIKEAADYVIKAIKSLK